MDGSEQLTCPTLITHGSNDQVGFLVSLNISLRNLSAR
jgi:hypothetical protein